MVTNSTYQSGPGDQSMSAMPKRKAGSKLTSGHLLMILSGLAAFLLIITLLGSQGKTITVYVSKEAIFSGQEISASDFEAREIPSSSLDSKYFSSEDFKGDKVFSSRTIEKGEPLLKVAQTPESNTSNQRLLSIPVPKKFAVAGILVKGDKVDIFEVPDDGCAIRMLAGISVVSVSNSSSGGLGGGGSDYTVTVALENDVDDVILAGVNGRGANVQLGRTTGVDTSDQYNGPECGGLPEE